VDERDVIIAADDVSECRQTFFDALYLDGVWNGVSDVLELLVGGGGGEEETLAVTARRRERPSRLASRPGILPS
jgi:hypothetical protein